MEALVGTTTVRELYLEAAGAPLQGQAITYTLQNYQGTSLLAGVPASDAGGGYYDVAIDGSSYLSLPGIYRERWLGTDLERSGWFRVGYGNGPYNTRTELRQAIGDYCDEVQLGAATAATATSITDPNLAQDTDHWQGATIYIYGGAGAGQSRLVANSTTAGLFTISLPWTTTPDTTSLFELHTIFAPDQIHRVLNTVIAQVADQALIDLEDWTTLISDADTHWYQVPPGIVYVSEIYQGSDSATWSRLRPAANKQYEDQYRLGAGGRLWIGTPSVGDRLRIVGQGLPEPLLRDDSIADVNPAYLTLKTAAHLLASKSRGSSRDPDNYLTRSKYLMDQAESPYVRPDRPPAPNAVRVG